MINRKTNTIAPTLFILPMLLLVLIFMVYPIFRGILMSFFEARGLTSDLGTFVGFENYESVMTTDRFWNSLVVTLLYSVSSVALIIVISLSLALLLNSDFPGRTAARVVITIPWAVSEVACVMVWVFMFDSNYGVLNFFLSKLGLIDSYNSWLNNVSTALPSIVVMTVWKISPFSIIIFLTSLQSVPKELYEVARIDGARPFRVLRSITIPLIKPTIMLLILINIIWSFKRFTIIWLTTQGGPSGHTESLVILIYKYVFQMFNTGYGATVGVLGLVVILFVTVLYFRVQRSDDM